MRQDLPIKLRAGLYLALTLSAAQGAWTGVSPLGRIYWVDGTKANYANANAYCKARGDELPSFVTHDERIWALSNANQIMSGTLGPVWMSQNDKSTEGTWVDYCGRAGVPGLKWLPGEPNNSGGEDCILAGQIETVTWESNDKECSESNYVVCEKTACVDDDRPGEHLSITTDVSNSNNGNIQCSVGYTQVGNGVATCTLDTSCPRNGVWQHLTFCCASCGDAPDIVDMTRDVDSTNTYAQVLTYTCTPGHSIENGHDGKVTCQCDGTWSTQPSCMQIYCPAKTILHGSISETGEVEAGNSVDVSCNEGYKVDPDGIFSCGIDGVWGTEPTCEPVTCPVPAILNGVATNSGSLSVGDALSVQCNAGFEANSDVGICGTNGNYATLPACTKTECSKPSVDHGTIGSDVIYAGDTIFMSCEVGYRLSFGNGFYKCGITGCVCALPECQRVECSVPPIPRVTVANTVPVYYGDKLEVTCESGFRLKSDGDAICTMSGWSTLPSCERLTCIMPEIEHGRAYEKKVFAGSTTELLCNNGYFPSNGTDIACNLKGQVTTVPTCLKFCNGPFYGGSCMDKTMIVSLVFTGIMVLGCCTLGIVCCKKKADRVKGRHAA